VRPRCCFGSITTKVGTPLLAAGLLRPAREDGDGITGVRTSLHTAHNTRPKKR
jgi:hypothetical protein